MPVIGYLHISFPEPYANQVAAFRKGLGEAGFVEGRNVAIEFRWAQNDSDRLPELAADLVRRRVTVIATPGGPAAALAAKAATAAIPIVFSSSIDPVQLGLVPSLSRPGGNITGFTDMHVDLSAKRLGLLHAGGGCRHWAANRSRCSRQQSRDRRSLCEPLAKGYPSTPRQSRLVVQ
jgi:putative ABC transport system substrate-binding protein